MALSEKERFVANILKDEFSKKHKKVKYTEVSKDPPDIYLHYDKNKVAIEITELSPNLQNNRISVDKAYEGFIKNIGIKIPNFTHYLVVFHHANIKLNKVRKKEILTFLKDPNLKMEKCINGIFVRIKKIPSKNKIGTISQISLNMNSCSRDINTVSESLMDFNIEHVLESIIIKAIETKKEKCKEVKKPVWLATHDSYFSYLFSENEQECLGLYQKILSNYSDFGVFDKIIITFKEKKMVVFNKT